MTKETNENIASQGLNALVEKVKLIARDILRAKLIAPIQSAIYALTNEIKNIDEEVKAETKEIARAKFKLSRIEKEDPDAEEKTKTQNDRITESTTRISELGKERESVEKQIEEKKAHITEIEEGKIKVNGEELADLVDKLLLEKGRESVRNLS